MITALLLFCVMGLWAEPRAGGETIQPNQVLIIGNSEVPESKELAKFYADARQIPSRNILLLPLPNREEIKRDQYDRMLAGPVREFLTKQKLEDKIKIIVTMYGVPLKVGAAGPDLKQRQLAEAVKQRYFSVFAELENRYGELQKMAGAPSDQPTTLPGRQEIGEFNRKIPQIAGKLQKSYQAIIPEIQKIKDPVDRNGLANQFGAIRLDLEGKTTFVRILLAQKSPQGPKLADELKEKENDFFSLLGTPPELRDCEKTYTYSLAREIGGIILELKTLREDYERLMQKESGAAVDSELSLVLWDAYPLAGRLPNGLNPRLAENPMIAGKGPILMVSRLDGPTADTVKRLIRDSLETEKTGLSGKVYLDARGIRQKDGFYAYDENLRDLAGELRRNTKLPIMLDDKAELFGPGTCPEAAIYCGWYSLRNYIPAFTFVRGSVGYHIASFEATTLKHPQTNEWVKRMLENGIAATVGAVDEPYLDAFPLPTEFFGLLMTGKYTLAEVFYKTARYNSWRIILIGDPLYRPFASKPMRAEKDIELQPLGLLLLN
jgi:uncharacterized protein (TIGR03790 family)